METQIEKPRVSLWTRLSSLGKVFGLNECRQVQLFLKGVSWSGGRLMPNLFAESRNERLVEYGWAIKQLPESPKEILDIGPGLSLFPIMMASLGNHVLGIDLWSWGWSHPNYIYQKMDVRTLKESLASQSFDVVTIISALEHMGVATQGHEDDLDFKVFRDLKGLLKGSSIILLTIPFGKTYRIVSVGPHNYFRIYDQDRLQCLLEGYCIDRVEYFVELPSKNGWIHASHNEALLEYSPKISHVKSIACLKICLSGDML